MHTNYKEESHVLVLIVQTQFLLSHTDSRKKCHYTGDYCVFKQCLKSRVVLGHRCPDQALQKNRRQSWSILLWWIYIVLGVGTTWMTCQIKVSANTESSPLRLSLHQGQSFFSIFRKLFLWSKVTESFRCVHQLLWTKDRNGKHFGNQRAKPVRMTWHQVIECQKFENSSSSNIELPKQKFVELSNYFEHWNCT